MIVDVAIVVVKAFLVVFMVLNLAGILATDEGHAPEAERHFAEALALSEACRA